MVSQLVDTRVVKKFRKLAGSKTLEVGGASTFLLWACALYLTCCLASGAKLQLGVKPGLKYDPVALHVQPGEKVELLFDNVDEMMHNFVLVSPGARMKMVEAALALGADGPARNYVPDSPEVLAATPVVLPGKKTSITFDAPDKEGAYPYVCTFPGHGFVMIGTLFVAKERPKEMDDLPSKVPQPIRRPPLLFTCFDEFHPPHVIWDVLWLEEWRRSTNESRSYTSILKYLFHSPIFIRGLFMCIVLDGIDVPRGDLVGVDLCDYHGSEGGNLPPRVFSHGPSEEGPSKAPSSP